MTRAEWRRQIDERNGTIKELRAAGMTGLAIAKQLNIPQATVYGALGHER